MKSSKLIWHFPLPRVHLGPILGNGTQGIMAWGVDTLRLTIGRNGFWDRRGGRDASVQTTFQELRRLLEAGDEAGVLRAFGARGGPAPAYRRPAQLGCARLELGDGSGPRPVRAELNLRTAVMTIHTTAGALIIRQAADEEVFWIEAADDLLSALPLRLRPIWDFLGEAMARDGCAPPERWGDARGGGFVQRLPEDEPLALAWERRPGRIIAATHVGWDAPDAVRRKLADADPARLARRAQRWWNAYWNDVPRLDIPDAVLSEAWQYGLYKQAGLTPPHAPPATLQGPWMEDHEFPPWSNDYHFNINVQLIYEPALATNRAAHFGPMWRMLLGWLPQLRRNALTFFGADDAILLPHAVDDRCHVVGHFWSGTIDQACAAWMALLAWRHYRHTLEADVLRDVAWPLLTGAFNGFYAMLERSGPPGEERFSLPVSVSPEYGGSSISACWGRDASFQLAALHAVAAALPRAAAELGAPTDPRWAAVTRGLPPYTTVPCGRNGEQRRIALWAGKDLGESHRHHSHLAAITPFRTIDPLAPEHREIVRESLYHWLRLGAGQWTGWCLPWAAAICARCNHADAAIAWLHWWNDVYVNRGRITLHDAGIGGAAAWDRGALLNPRREDEYPEIMQCDAALGAVGAITELLVQTRGDEIYITPALPARWRDFEFDGIAVEGGFRVGATVDGGRVREIRVSSTRGGTARVRWGRPRHTARDGDAADEIRELRLAGGESVSFKIG